MDIKRLTALLVVPVLAVGLWGCDVEQTEEGRLPDIDVEGDAGNMPEYDIEQTEEGEMPDMDIDAEEGNMPEYDVQGPDVEIEEEQVEMTVPEIDIETPDEQ